MVTLLWVLSVIANKFLISFERGTIGKVYLPVLTLGEQRERDKVGMKPKNERNYCF